MFKLELAQIRPKTEHVSGEGGVHRIYGTGGTQDGGMMDEGLNEEGALLY